MVEHVAEQDDELMEKYLMGEELTSEENSLQCIRKATLANCMVPVCCGTSYRNKGVQKLIGCNRSLYAVSVLMFLI